MRGPGTRMPPSQTSPMRHAAPRAREWTPDTVTVGAAHRSAARAWGARPVPFRTRKLSPIAPRVLRGEPVGGQGAADRWTAPSRHRLEEGGGLAASPFFALYAIFALSVLGVLGLTLVEVIVVICVGVEPIFLFMSLSVGAQSTLGFCRHVYPDGSFAPYFQ